jgi:hypothetical protein
MRSIKQKYPALKRRRARIYETEQRFSSFFKVASKLSFKSPR